jgi:putative membrane protein
MHNCTHLLTFRELILFNAGELPMSTPNPDLNSINPATELAKERNRAAEERTLMAWIRTSLSLISFGFGIDQIVTVLNQQLDQSLNAFPLARILGLSFVALGTFALLYAALDHRRQLYRIRRNDLVYVSRRSPSLVVAYILAGLGIIVFFGVLLGPFIT